MWLLTNRPGERSLWSCQNFLKKKEKKRYDGRKKSKSSEVIYFKNFISFYHFIIFISDYYFNIRKRGCINATRTNQGAEFIMTISKLLHPTSSISLFSKLKMVIFLVEKTKWERQTFFANYDKCNLKHKLSKIVLFQSDLVSFRNLTSYSVYYGAGSRFLLRAE